MGAGLFALLWALCAAPLAAQNWNADVSDDGGYAGGFVVYPGLGMGFNCAARSVQNKPLMETMWFESTVAPPYQFQITFDQNLVPSDRPQRSDIVMFVDQTGYRLPAMEWNELDGEWQVNLSMTDASIRALQTVTRLVLQVGSQAAWDIPVTGLGPALEQARQHCAATWLATGNPAPSGFGSITAAANPPVPQPQPGMFELPTQVQAYANQQCNGQAAIAPDALQAGDLDRDGVPDVVMNWRDVLCPGETLSGFCGAANCSIHVFLSSRGYANPWAMLGTGVGIVPHRSGALALDIGGTFSVCGQGACDTPWIWTGSEFEQVP